MTRVELLLSINVPIGVQDSSSMSPKQWDQVRQLPPLPERDDSERAAAAGLPVDGEVLGVDLCKPRIQS